MADTVHASAGSLMGLVREHLYAPDGKAPDGYDDARDMGILRRWLKAGLEPDDLADMIRGGALLRDRGAFGSWVSPGEKLTLRAFNPREWKYGRHIAQASREAWRRHEEDQERRKGKGHGLQAVPDDELVKKLTRAMAEAQR